MGLLVHSHGSKYLGAREGDTFKANQEYLVNHFLRTKHTKMGKITSPNASKDRRKGEPLVRVTMQPLLKKKKKQLSYDPAIPLPARTWRILCQHRAEVDIHV